jgi:DNA-binding transcriptional ArsR family regulator
MSKAPLDTALAALADPTRRAVVDLLRNGPRAAGELAQSMQMSPPALSRHLRVLRHSGLVVGDGAAHDARLRMYRLEPSAFASLRDWLDELEAFWGEQLQAFAAHAAQASKRKAK